MQIRTRKFALTEGLAAGFLFGTASILIRFLQDFDAFSIAFWRLVVAFLALSAILVVVRRSFNIRIITKNIRKIVVLSFFLGLHFLLFISAVKDTTILNATVLVNTTPIFSVFVSSFVFKLKPSRTAIIGLATSFVGVCVIAFAETVTSPNLQGVSPSLKGDLEAMLAALVESFYLSYGKALRNQMSIFSSMMPIYALTAAFVGLSSLPFTKEFLILPVQTEALLLLLGLGLLPTALAHTLYFSSLSNLKSFETATMALLEPIGATILGISLFQEVPAPLFVLGTVMIMVGLFFVGKSKN